MKILKLVVRGFLYVSWMVAAMVILYQPIGQYLQTQTMDRETLVLHAALGFGLILVGSELSDYLRRRWQDE